MDVGVSATLALLPPGPLMTVVFSQGQTSATLLVHILQFICLSGAITSGLVGLSLWLRYWGVRSENNFIAKTSDFMVIAALIVWSAGTANIAQVQLALFLGGDPMSAWLIGAACSAIPAIGAALATLLGNLRPTRLRFAASMLLIVALFISGLDIWTIQAHWPMP